MYKHILGKYNIQYTYETLHKENTDTHKQQHTYTQKIERHSSSHIWIAALRNSDDTNIHIN